MSYRVIVVFAAAALAGGIAGCGEDASPTGGGAPERQANQQAPETEGMAGGRRVSVTMSDFKFEPSKLDATAGKLTITAKNVGREEHELVLVRTKRAPDAIPVKGDEASEANAVGEIPEQRPGQSATKTFTLEPGSYVFLCNVPGHYASGMRGRLAVAARG